MTSYPKLRTLNPFFSSGPTCKFPYWKTQIFDNAHIARSHRSSICIAQIQFLLQEIHTLLKLPSDYHVILMGGSDTAAIEACFWNLLGPQPIDILVTDIFSQTWKEDITERLNLKNVNIFHAKNGEMPSFNKICSKNDLVLCWNGTTSGLMINNADWIDNKREGLVITDATSAIFGIEMPWQKIDAATFSWQKCLGGEPQHGILILSPKAIERLNHYTPPWPIPKILSLKKNALFNQDLSKGMTLNTVSMLLIYEMIEILKWVKEIGGVRALQNRSQQSSLIIEKWIEKSSWAAFFVKSAAYRSIITQTFSLKAPFFKEMCWENQYLFIQKMANILEKEKIAYDIIGHKLAFPVIRLWSGPTICPDNIQRLLPWLDWAYEKAKNQ